MKNDYLRHKISKNKQKETDKIFSLAMLNVDDDEINGIDLSIYTTLAFKCINEVIAEKSVHNTQASN